MSSGPYADLGPEIPLEAVDLPPMRIGAIRPLPVLSPLGEFICTMTVLARDTGREMQLLISANPHDGAITRLSVNWARGAGFTASDPALLPGNVHDIVRTIVSELERNG